MTCANYNILESEFGERCFSPAAFDSHLSAPQPPPKNHLRKPKTKCELAFCTAVTVSSVHDDTKLQFVKKLEPEATILQHIDTILMSHIIIYFKSVYDRACGSDVAGVVKGFTGSKKAYFLWTPLNCFYFYLIALRNNIALG